jgi:acetyl-CoA carboxylase carboxyl transferase subunit alpha
LAENNNRKPISDVVLPFERKIVELEALRDKATAGDERDTLDAELERERKVVFAGLTPWQRMQLARHPNRPRMMDYVRRVFEDFVELHGDRLGGDDPAMITGLGRFKGRTVVVVGQQKGDTTDERIRRNFGMPHPEGYRKALRAFEMAERLHLPIVTLVDTPAADPSVESEDHGQASAIARNLWAMLRLKTPIFTAILGEGGSGGALAIAVGDKISMFEYAIYVVCPPERCAEILWRDIDKKEMAASALKITAADLHSLGVIDQILPEPGGGAHRDPDQAAQVLSEELDRFLGDYGNVDNWDPTPRQHRFRRLGQWREVG